MPDFPDFRPGQQSVPANQMQAMSNSLRRITGAMGGQGNNLLDVVGATIQNSPPDDNWWIIITEGPGPEASGSSGSPVCNAPYGHRQYIRYGCATGSADPSGSSALPSTFPAYEINGNRNVPIGSIHRAWVANGPNNSAILEFDAGGASGDNCNVIDKSVISLCWNGSTLRQIFALKRCCDCAVLATGCEDVPVCTSLCSNSGSGSVGPPVGGGNCFCPDPPTQRFRQFTLSTIAAGTCFGDCTLFNRNYCLQWVSSSCSFVYVVNVSGLGAPCVIGGPPQTIIAILTIHNDGSASLIIVSGTTGFAGTVASYYKNPFDCTGNNTFDLLSFGSGVGDCTGWPSQITVYPANDSSICTNPPGGGHDCAACAANTWQALMTSSPPSNGTCTGCVNVGNAITLSETSACVYESALADEPSITCAGPTVKKVHYRLIDNGSTGWDLFITTDSGATVLAHYFLAYAAWSCTDQNGMAISGGSDPSCGMSSAWFVTKTG